MLRANRRCEGMERADESTEGGTPRSSCTNRSGGKNGGMRCPSLLRCRHAAMVLTVPIHESSR
jgi:hypothetical protein